MNIIGVDVGGTKTAVCLSDEKGAIRASKRFSSSHAETQAAYFKHLRETCEAVVQNAGLRTFDDVEAVGISAPGPLDVSRGLLLAPPNNPGWENVPFVATVQSWFKAPVFMNHDGKACVSAEWLFGSHRGTRNLVYLTFSTGMGAGLILNGELVQGAADSAGEVGHHMIDAEGPMCGCGKRGCWESFVGGRNVALMLQDKIRKDNIQTRMVALAGGQIEKITALEFEKAAREGDPFAVREWDVFTERLAQGIGNIIMILNPDVVVLGTMAIYAGDFIMNPLREKLPKYVWPWPLEHCQIVASSLGSRIGDLSAVAVAVIGLQKRGH